MNLGADFQAKHQRLNKAIGAATGKIVTLCVWKQRRGRVLSLTTPTRI